MANIERAEIEAQLKEVLAKELGIRIENITPDKKLFEDLGMDSFGSVELMFSLEEKMGINIPDSDLINLKTVEDVVNYIVLRLAQKCEPAP